MLIIVMSAVFTVYHVEAHCLTPYSDQETVASISAEVAQAAEEEVKYQNIFLFDEEELLDRVNMKVLRAEAVDVECKFPNTVQVKYNLVSEDVQIKFGDKYLVAGSSGKIIISDDIDRTDVSAGIDYIDSLISVIPYASPENSSVGKYLYNDKSAYDLVALDLLIEYASSLVDKDTEEGVYLSSSYKSINLSDTRKVVVKMERGVTFELESRLSSRFDRDTESLKTAVREMISWYVSDETPEAYKESGTARVAYSDEFGKYAVFYTA